MVVCLCNGISDGDVRAAIAQGAQRPAEVYACCGGRAQCSCCAPTVLQILREGPAKG
ncbi:MAG: (2Fe-2S)-binding protein [Roseococcus sp.]|nr:(2Fe-2S)-binding protein [Roseococcus sp.]